MDTLFAHFSLFDGAFFLTIGGGTILLIALRRACQTDIVCPKNTRIIDLWGHYQNDSVTQGQIAALTTRLNSKPAGLPEWETPSVYTASH